MLCPEETKGDLYPSSYVGAPVFDPACCRAWTVEKAAVAVLGVMAVRRAVGKARKHCIAVGYVGTAIGNWDVWGRGEIGVVGCYNRAVKGRSGG